MLTLQEVLSEQLNPQGQGGYSGSSTSTLVAVRQQESIACCKGSRPKFESQPGTLVWSPWHPLWIGYYIQVTQHGLLISGGKQQAGVRLHRGCGLGILQCANLAPQMTLLGLRPCVYVWWVSVFLLTLHTAYGAHGLESCRSLIPKGQPRR